ncbi:hypothetical protein [Rhodococcus koreensis]
MNTVTHTEEFWANKTRDLQRIIIKSADDARDGEWVFLVTTEGLHFGRPKQQLGRVIRPGDVFDLETVNGWEVTGMRDECGMWLFRTTNADLAEQHRKQSEEFEERKRVEYLRNCDKWAALEAALPQWIRARIERFRTAAGDKFDRDGWGYELVIARLAVAYADGDEDTVERIAAEEGSTGNQHDCARALAEIHNRGDDIGYLPSGLAPITGSVDYS